MSKIHFQDAFPTIFLPMELPVMPLAEKTDGERNECDSVLKCWKQFLEQTAPLDNSEAMLRDVSTIFVKMHLKPDGLKNHKWMKECLEETPIHGYWGCHVRAQNAAVLVYREDKQSALIMAWQVGRCNAEVINHVSSFQEFPERMEKVNWNRLLESIETISDLAVRDQWLAVPKTRKSGTINHEVRDVNDPCYVLDVLIPAMGGAIPPRTLWFTLKKKMRDQVRYKSGLRPWRREPVWAAIKNILLLVCFRSTKCTATYKSLVQRFLAFCLENVCKSDAEVSLCSMAEASKKLARRLEKMRDSSANRTVVPTLETETSQAVDVAMNIVKNDWEAQCNPSRKPAVLDFSLLDASKATKHSLPNCGPLLEVLDSKAKNDYGSICCIDSNECITLTPTETYPLTAWSLYKIADVMAQIESLHISLNKKFNMSPQDFIDRVHNIAEVVFTEFQEIDTAYFSARLPLTNDLEDLVYVLFKFEEAIIEACLGLGKYSKISFGSESPSSSISHPFEDDVRCRSIAILIAFSLSLIIDRLACFKYPMLMQYKLGISSAGLFDRLFLPSFKYRRHLHNVEQYLNNRNAASECAFLDSSCSPTSFAVRFASQNLGMQKARKEILDECQLKQEKKRQEKAMKQNEYDEIQRRLRLLFCSCTRYLDCDQCKLKDAARQIKMSHHEKYLPDSECGQWAVIFDLQCPPVLACARDSLVFFAKLVCQERLCSASEQLYYWREEARLAPWLQTLPTSIARLGSTAKSHSRTHYGKSSCVTYHPTFVVSHGYNVNDAVSISGSEGLLSKVSHWQLSFEAHTEMNVPGEDYLALKPFFSFYSHDENRVIALKSEASHNLDLHEFEVVGCSRAGPSLQLERLLIGLQLQKFALDRAEIVSLICCILWQVGPRTEKKGIRVTSKILESRPAIFIEFCHVLHTLADGCKLNWSNNHILLNVTHLATHLLEHAHALENDSNSHLCVEVLLKCRGIAKCWILTLLQKLDASIDDSTRQHFREKIVDITSIGTSSFLDRPDLIGSDENIQNWLFFRVHFFDNSVPAEMLMKSWRRPHLISGLSTAATVTACLQNLLRKTCGGLSLFVADHWRGGKQVSRWRADDRQYRRWYFSTYQLGPEHSNRKCMVRVNVVTGEFLVNGFPCSRLPKEVTAHPLYRRLFGTASFSVQPIGCGVYRTNRDVCGFTYEFYPAGYNDSIPLMNSCPIIISTRDKDRSMLIPNTILQKDVDHLGDFPTLLISRYSHWFVLNSASAEIISRLYFRPIEYSDGKMEGHFDQDDYYFDFSSRQLIDQSTQSKYLDTASVCFQEIYSRVFYRMSDITFVHAYMIKDVSRLTIELPRLEQIHFDFDGKSLRCREYGKRLVSSSQELGTLIGLEHGLLTEDESGLANGLFLCPHGRVFTSGKFTSVQLKDSTKIAKYEVRKEFKDLHSIGRSRHDWLYLGLLHACTSGILPDPFTKCTGTQKAFSILHSCYCKNTFVGSLDDDTITRIIEPEIKMLKCLGELSPTRKDYHSMEKVNFGMLLPLCGHNGFAFMASKRIRNLRDSLALTGKDHLIENIVLIDLNDSTGNLSKKAYHQNRCLYPDDGNLSTGEDFSLDEKKDICPAYMASSINKLPCGSQKIHDMSFAVNQREYSFFPQLSIVSLLGNRDTLQGSRSETPSVFLNTAYSSDCLFAKERSADASAKVPFEDIWIELFRKAKEGTNDINAFNCLLTWLSAEYPEYDAHLCQLGRIAFHSHSFPLIHYYSKYEATDEIDFIHSHIGNVIDRHLPKFSESKPTRACGEEEQDYDSRLRAWQRRRIESDDRNQATRSELKVILSREFNIGNYIASSTLGGKEITDCSTLIRDVNAFFDRWRRNSKLMSFAKLVDLTLSQIGSRKERVVLPKLIMNSRCFWSKDTFCIVQNDMKNLPADKELCFRLHEIARTGQIPDGFNFKIPEQEQETSQFSFFSPNQKKEDSLQEKMAEDFLYHKLCSELQQSINLATSKKDFRVSLFQMVQLLSEILTRRLTKYLESSSKHMKEVWALVKKHHCVEETNLLSKTGLLNAIIPWNLLASHFGPKNLTHLKSLFSPRRRRTGIIPYEISLQAFAVAIKHSQKARRCLRQLNSGKSSDLPRLIHELRSHNCITWTPEKYPEFLALEIDVNICIRPEQAMVAEEMLQSDHGNRLLQLNMGLGKSAVIMPLVLCCAADGKFLSRGTVLSSLYATNVWEWQSRIGGLLGRCIFSMLCRRDVTFDNYKVLQLQAMLSDCLEKRHIIVTVPEHRLSLENKALEACSAGKFEVGAGLMNIVSFLSKQGRDFLDESDEILSPKFQLVYTLGSPVDMDGGLLRWMMHGTVLQSVSSQTRRLFDKFGPNNVQIVSLSLQQHEFSSIRLLDGPNQNELYLDLCDFIVQDIIWNGVPRGKRLPFMNVEVHDIWTRCVKGEKIDETEIRKLPSGKLRISALVLRGILAHETLRVVLQKRFRVQYGSHPSRPKYRMAVPYRAKDVASERTDFANPEISVSLTFSTYYQSGLDESQLYQVFQKLSRMDDARAIYDAWIDVGSLKTSEIAEYSVINLEDRAFFQEKLFPVFRKHMDVIDFWLLRIILPSQAKQFPQQIAATSVDLCKSPDLVPHWESVTTGFSGTDDLSRVLPPTIEQQNLKFLEKTNGQQFLCIAREENNTYYHLEEASGNEKGMEKGSAGRILNLLENFEDKTNVVLDAGALVLEMSNEEFSRRWLKRRDDCIACAYFEKDSVFLVKKDDKSRVYTFADSHFVGDMSQCLLYLDEIHTRGSDFVLPINARGLLTLGKGMTRDKFVQACMRLRQLGHNQTLSFVAAPDVHRQLEKIPIISQEHIQKVNIMKIIHWTLKNTAVRLCDLVPYFVGQAASGIRKANAFKEHYYARGQERKDDDLKALADCCTDDEILDLEELYIHQRGENSLINIAQDRLHNLPSSELTERVINRVRAMAPYAKRQCSLLDEEQERELEHELDEERQVERPPPATPCPAIFSMALKNFLKTSTLPLKNYFETLDYLVSLGFARLSKCFLGTTFDQSFVKELEKSTVLVTDDFINTVSEPRDKNFYLKRFCWMISIPTKAGIKFPIIILVSNYEAEAIFREEIPIHETHLRSSLLQSFVPYIQRNQIQFDQTRPSWILSKNLPMELHVFGGSINPPNVVLAGMKDLLGLHPSPLSGWPSLYRQNIIESDGYVPICHRYHEEEHGGVMTRSAAAAAGVGFVNRNIFASQSPCDFWRQFLCDARHLGGELYTSILCNETMIMDSNCKDDNEKDDY